MRGLVGLGLVGVWVLSACTGFSTAPDPGSEGDAGSSSGQSREAGSSSGSAPDASSADTGTSSSSSGSNGAPTEPAEMNGMLAAHNAVRATVGVPPLTWSNDAAAVAAAFVAQCEYAPNADRGELGQNSSAFAGNGYQNKTPEEVVQRWAASSAQYNYPANTCDDPGGSCGTYTQIVWRNTTAVGCARAFCTTGSPSPSETDWAHWVCHYSPAGNVSGELPY